MTNETKITVTDLPMNFRKVEARILEIVTESTVTRGDNARSSVIKRRLFEENLYSLMRELETEAVSAWSQFGTNLNDIRNDVLERNRPCPLCRRRVPKIVDAEIVNTASLF